MIESRAKLSKTEKKMSKSEMKNKKDYLHKLLSSDVDLRLEFPIFADRMVKSDQLMRVNVQHLPPIDLFLSVVFLAWD